METSFDRKVCTLLCTNISDGSIYSPLWACLPYAIFFSLFIKARKKLSDQGKHWCYSILCVYNLLSVKYELIFSQFWFYLHQLSSNSLEKGFTTWFISSDKPDLNVGAKIHKTLLKFQLWNNFNWLNYLFWYKYCLYAFVTH